MIDKPKTDAQLLREAKELIADPKRWAQGAFARDSGGAVVAALDPAAVRWCAIGALVAVDRSDGRNQCFAAHNALAGHLHGCSGLQTFNDSHEHAEVLALFDRAIAGTEQEEKTNV